jgi:hypothetical protein
MSLYAEGHGSSMDGINREIVSIAEEAGHAEEQCAGTRLIAAVAK